MENLLSYTIEYRILRDRNDAWADLPVFTMVIETEESMQATFENKFQFEPNIVEIRWNYKGFSQGHYVPGPAYTPPCTYIHEVS